MGYGPQGYKESDMTEATWYARFSEQVLVSFPRRTINEW